MNLVDLPDLMHERSEHDPVPILMDSRIDAIGRKVVAGRRRRAIGTLAGLVAVALIGIGVSVPFQHTHSAPSTAAAKPKGFATFTHGQELFATKTADLHGGPVTQAFDSVPLPISLDIACSKHPSAITIWVSVSVNGQDEGESSCDPLTLAILGSFGTAGTGLRAGDPATYTFTVSAYTSKNQGRTRTPVPIPAGTISIGFYHSVPVEQYPLPPRPKTLPKLDVAGKRGLRGFILPPHPVISVVDSDPSDPLRPQTSTFIFPSCSHVSQKCVLLGLEMQTPGYLTVAFNGVNVGGETSYSYDGGISPLDSAKQIAALGLHAGDKVTVTITPRLVTGGWQFGIAQKPAP